MLTALVDNCGTKPFSMNTLYALIDVDKRAYEETIEPHLLQKGLISRVPRGHVVTQKALDHLIKEHSYTIRG